MALAIVLWLVAALTMMAAGLASLSRDEVSSVAAMPCWPRVFIWAKG